MGIDIVSVEKEKEAYLQHQGGHDKVIHLSVEFTSSTTVLRVPVCALS